MILKVGAQRMGLKNRLISTSMLLLCSCCFASCTAKQNLQTVSFDVSRDISSISNDDYKPSVRVFENREELIDFASVYPYDPGEDFYADIEHFETKFGFADHLIVYFGQMLNVATSVKAYIDETENEKIVITFEYDVPESDTYLPADSYFDEFYLVEKGDLGGQRKTVTIKIGTQVVYTESFDENIL